MTQDLDRNDETMDRRLDLLADKALQGLDDLESVELAAFEGSVAEAVDALDMELAAAVVAGLDLSDTPALPDLLAKIIERDAKLHVPPALSAPSRPPLRREAFTRQLGWWVAAASIAFALINLPRPKPLETVSEAPVEAKLEGSPAADLVNTKHPLGVGASGRVVWNSSRQEGYLALKGLAPIDRRKGIYQLWIFDSERDERYPVDGGVFAIEKANATTIVPIHPGLEVKKPTLFAVTLEPPGGVVVSDRQRLLLTATWNPTDGISPSSSVEKP